jgi:transcriptional regulator with XRE-family HTH domain
MGKEKRTDPAMETVRLKAETCGMTYQELGEKMGYAPTTARQAVSQFLKSGDPQISMLRRFAEAIGVTLNSLLK